ncbi:hypothetical protein OQA88_12656 [Cercophora sp. LCS_1]
MVPAPGRDARVDKIRRHLREGTTIPKEDFLDFVNVYPHFHQAGYKVRPGVAKWIEENSDTVLGWLPDILKISPAYFEEARTGSKASAYDEYSKLAALGLAGHCSSRSPGSMTNTADSQPSSDLDLPTRVSGPNLSDFGTAIPKPVMSKRPSLSGEIQQKVWVDDMKEMHQHLRSLTKWMMKTAEDLGPDDGFSEVLIKAVEKVPDFSSHIETAEACFGDVKLRYESACAEQARRRAQLRRYSPSLGADEEGTAPTAPKTADGHDPTSILVESDIIGAARATSTPTGISTPAAFANAHFSRIDAPQVSTSITPPFPRRYAPPNNLNSMFLKRKHTKDSSNQSGSVYSVEDSDSDGDKSPGMPNPAMTGKTSKPDVGDDEDAPRPKRARISMGEARRPPRTLNGDKQGQSSRAPETVME